MAKHVGKKFTWVIKSFSSLESEECIYSEPVLIGDCKWRLRAYEAVDEFSLDLEVADLESLPCGWRRLVKFRLSIVPQVPNKIPVWEEGLCWFDKFWAWGFQSMITLTELHDKDEGFLVNGELIIVAEVDVLEATGTLDELNDDCGESNELLKEDSSVEESMIVNGFQVLPWQVESVRRILERHPDIAVELFRGKNQQLRTTCMNLLLMLIDTLCKSLEELSNEDLVDADFALTYLKDVSFKVDWLEEKLEQVKEKKEKELYALAKLQETEENILKLNALAEEQKAELLATRTTLTFDDVV